jgi:hypothetical protein
VSRAGAARSADGAKWKWVVVGKGAQPAIISAAVALRVRVSRRRHCPAG